MALAKCGLRVVSLKGPIFSYRMHGEVLQLGAVESLGFATPLDCKSCKDLTRSLESDP